MGWTARPRTLVEADVEAGGGRCGGRWEMEVVAGAGAGLEMEMEVVLEGGLPAARRLRQLA